ncbi:DUF882 domain-containing protein [Bartonella sp. HY329]|uniref:DUF882 domain-containing protein n=1 Tax=unclassified Bartonella TaxID=2645622 RepID=UPI0021C63368|nr:MULTISPECIES: DUF882 domain-containing protein [unclassified Bartonella]UXM94153.1 DUF882 domain-containing protein [Bartonella sp. HY329]UXN08475.1 DUF882 domain-containing protein [Bartonella sp. HY328]
MFKNILAIIIASCGFLLSIQAANSETRSLKLYYIHTHEKAEIVFKKNGKYVDSGLRQLNVFLRDWRRNEPTKMDPRLFDLIWQVYKLSGSRDYIHVVSAYRSPTTNNMLRSRSASSGVAKNSQHTLGRAMDFYIPDANLSKLRQIGLKQEVGGVGYYPRSGSPFVHMDVGNVRHWPRMSRSELMALFPDGKTIHVPSDGKPLARYQQAMAEYNARKGRPAQTVIVKDEGSSGGGLFAKLFGGKKKDPAPQKQTVVASRPQNLRPQAPQIIPQEVEQEAIDDMIDLPEGGQAPIPLASPARTQEIPTPNTPNDNIAAPQDSVNDLIANSNSIPVPGFKPGDIPVLAVAAQPNANSNNQAVSAVNDAIGDTINAHMAQPNTLTPSDDTMTAYNIPIPTMRHQSPEIAQKGDQIAAAIARTSANQPKLEPTANKAPIRADEVNSIINGNSELIPLPDEDYADGYNGSTQTANTGQKSAIDNSLSVASVTPNKNTSRAPSTNPQTVEQLISSDDKGAAQELHKIPALVFAAGLKKEKAQLQNAKLTGRAINFQAIARINN